MRQDKIPLSDRIRKDESFKRYRRILDKIIEFDIVSLNREAKNLHSGRDTRNLIKSSINPKGVSDANLKDISYRSRMVEIRVNITEKRDLLKTTIDIVRRHLTYEYSAFCDVKSVAGRKIFFDRYFRSGLELLSRMDTTIDMLDHFIKDIDQTGFGLKNAVAILQMIYRPETKV